MIDTKSNTQVISKYEKYFKVFLWLPLIYSAIVGFVMLVVGIVLCANVSGALIMVGIFGAPIMAVLTYYFASVLLSYRILHIYYLKEMTNRTSKSGCDMVADTDETPSVTALNSLTSIKKNAHRNDSDLASVTIPDGVTSIEEQAFCGCSNLTSIIIPDSVTSIGKSAFSNTGYYKDTSNWENEVLYIGKYLIEAKDDTISDSYTIKDGTLCIADNAFSGCFKLTSITIPDSVRSIGWRAFWGCSNLANVTIGDSVTSIGTSAFSGCFSLTSIILPESVKSIENFAFQGCSSITSIILPNGVTHIGNHAFSGCSSLTSITIPESVKSIESSAFENCYSLANIKYRGTQAQWNAINKGNWLFSIPVENIIAYDYNG